MAAPTLINLTGFQRGVSANETNMNIEEIATTVEPQFQDPLPDKDGNVRGLGIGDAQKTVSLKGEVSGTLSWTLTAAVTLTNSTTYFGAGSTISLFLSRGTVTENRGSWKGVDAEFKGWAGITSS